MEEMSRHRWELLVLITWETSGVEYWELLIFLFSGTMSPTVILTGLQLALSHQEVSEGHSNSQSFKKPGDLSVISILNCNVSWSIADRFPSQLKGPQILWIVICSYIATRELRTSEDSHCTVYECFKGTNIENCPKCSAGRHMNITWYRYE